MNGHYQIISDRVLDQVSLEPLRGKRVLITGSNGLLGSHLASVIARSNQRQALAARVLCLSRSKPVSWLVPVLASPGFSFSQLDLASGLPPRLSPPDFVIHAATYGQPKKFLENPSSTMILNTQTTHELLELVSAVGGSLLFMSSSEIYGSPPAEFTPTREDYPGNVAPLDQRSPYTSSKRMGETWCKVYQESRGIRARIARVSSAYGPGANLTDDRVLNVLIRGALEMNEIRLMDQGRQRRRWLYISDALVMLLHILLRGRELVYNVAGDDLRSVAELGSYIGELVGVPVILPPDEQHAEHTAGAPALIDIDISRIRAEAGLGPLIPLREGLAPCIQWTRDLMEGAV